MTIRVGDQKIKTYNTGGDPNWVNLTKNNRSNKLFFSKIIQINRRDKFYYSNHLWYPACGQRRKYIFKRKKIFHSTWDASRAESGWMLKNPRISFLKNIEKKYVQWNQN